MLTKYREEAKECVTYGKTKETCDKRGNRTTQVFELKMTVHYVDIQHLKTSNVLFRYFLKLAIFIWNTRSIV